MAIPLTDIFLWILCAALAGLCVLTKPSISDDDENTEKSMTTIAVNYLPDEDITNPYNGCKVCIRGIEHETFEAIMDCLCEALPITVLDLDEIAKAYQRDYQQNNNRPNINYNFFRRFTCISKSTGIEYAGKKEIRKFLKKKEPAVPSSNLPCEQLRCSLYPARGVPA